MNRYDSLRARHLADFGSRLGEHLERIEWTPAQIAAEQTRALRELLGVAIKGSSWHRERLRGVRPDSFNLCQLAELPAMTKTDLMSSWDAIVTDPRLSLSLTEGHLEQLTGDAYLLDHFHAVASGGSSGSRGVFVYDWDAWTLAYLGFARITARDWLADPQLNGHPIVSASVAAEHATHMTSAFAQTFETPGETHRFPITLPLEEIVSGLNRARPNLLIAYASSLALLAHEATAGRLRIEPRRVIATSEPLLPEVRKLCEEAWSASVGNWWGTSEGGPTAISCSAGPGMHLSEDLLIVEPVDGAGRPVLAMQPAAKVLLTNLYNHALPLIRYELTDEVTLIDEPCACGSGHRRVCDIEGRLDDCFVYGRGLSVHPLVFRSPLGRRPEVAVYQVRQTVRGAAIAVHTVGPCDLRLLEREIAKDLEGVGLDQPEVSVTRVPELARQASGKLKRFLPLAREP